MITNPLSQLWHFVVNTALSFVIVLLIMVGATAVICIVYGIWVQRILKGKGKLRTSKHRY